MPDSGIGFPALLYCWAAALLLPLALNHLWKADLARPRSVVPVALLASAWWLNGQILEFLSQLQATIQSTPLAAFFLRTFQNVMPS